MIELQKQSFFRTLKDLVENNMLTYDDKMRMGKQTHRALKLVFDDLHDVSPQNNINIPQYQIIADFFPVQKLTPLDPLEEERQLTADQIIKDKQLAVRIVNAFYAYMVEQALAHHLHQELIEKLRELALEDKTKKEKTDRELLLSELLGYQELELMKKQILQELLKSKAELEQLNQYLDQLFKQLSADVKEREDIFEQHSTAIAQDLCKLKDKNGKTIFESEEQAKQFARAYVESYHVMERNLAAEIKRCHPEQGKKLDEIDRELAVLNKQRDEMLAAPQNSQGFLPGMHAINVKGNGRLKEVEGKIKKLEEQKDCIMNFFRDDRQKNIIKKLGDKFNITALIDDDNVKAVMDVSSDHVKAAHKEANKHTNRINENKENIAEGKKKEKELLIESQNNINSIIKESIVLNDLENSNSVSEDIQTEKEVLIKKTLDSEYQADTLVEIGLDDLDLDLHEALDNDSVYENLEEIDIELLEEKLRNLEQDDRPDSKLASSAPKL